MRPLLYLTLFTLLSGCPEDPKTASADVQIPDSTQTGTDSDDTTVLPDTQAGPDDDADITV